jgi:glycosyltransferase involved in cell wall biosynthesis
MPDNASEPDFKRWRILALLPIPYSDRGGFWNRDIGLVMRTLHAQGHDAWLVALKNPDDLPAAGFPVIVATKEELNDPQWWWQQQPDAIILNTWSAPRYEGMRRAALSTGKPLIEKLDTDGVKSPRIWFRRYLSRHMVGYRYSDPFYRKWKLWLEAWIRVSVINFFPWALDAKMVRGMSQVSIYAAETPIAVARVKRFLRLFHATPMPRVLTIPHPVNTENLRLQAGDVKENYVIAVGRWKEAVKGWPLLFEIAKRFLRIYPDWKMVIIGDEPVLSAKDRRERAALGDRLTLTGALNHARLSDWCRRSKIYLLTSHWETFNIAAAEALCCGCSMVGPAQIGSVSCFTANQSGTPSFRRTPDDLTDALVAEVDEWDNGRRDPKSISDTALAAWSVETVGDIYLRLFGEMEAEMAAKSPPR